MATLREFLTARDLDDLLKIRRDLTELTEDETREILFTLERWEDGQAVSNLLFYPGLIPESHRYVMIDKALASYDEPYLALAAVVGLPGPDHVPDRFREAWFEALLNMIRSDAGVLSSRASVKIWAWATDDNYQSFVQLFPVPDKTASRNIIAFTLSRFGHLPKDKYIALLRDVGVGPQERAKFIETYEEYQRIIKEEGASFAALPLYSYIPNYDDVAT